MLSMLSHVFVASAALWSAAALAEPPAAPTPGATPPRLAVVELFTSEGCSSCPPADALLAKLAAETKDKSEHVYFLVFHVDYWDSLGWKDPFASKEASQRQRSYTESPASSEDKKSVYTPQMIVNGRDRFVGSDEKQARAAIEEALKRPPLARVQPTLAARKPGDPIQVTAQITGRNLDSPAQLKTLRGATVLAALVEDDLASEVIRGENAGRTLKHQRVVRAMATMPVPPSPDETLKAYDTRAELALNLPDGIREEHCRIVVLVQRPGVIGIMGAAEIPLTPPAKDTTPTPPPTPATFQTPNPAPK